MRGEPYRGSWGPPEQAHIRFHEVDERGYVKGDYRFRPESGVAWVEVSAGIGMGYSRVGRLRFPAPLWDEMQPWLETLKESFHVLQFRPTPTDFEWFLTHPAPCRVSLPDCDTHEAVMDYLFDHPPFPDEPRAYDCKGECDGRWVVWRSTDDADLLHWMVPYGHQPI